MNGDTQKKIRRKSNRRRRRRVVRPVHHPIQQQRSDTKDISFHRAKYGIKLAVQRKGTVTLSYHRRLLPTYSV